MLETRSFNSYHLPHLETNWRGLPTGQMTLCRRKEFGETTTLGRSWKTIPNLGLAIMTQSMATTAIVRFGGRTATGTHPGLKLIASERLLDALARKGHLPHYFASEVSAQPLFSKEEIESLGRDGLLSRIQICPIHVFS